MSKKKKAFATVMVIMTALVLVASIPSETTAQFVISAGSYPDGYGQGIEVLYVYENSTGSWVALFDPAFLIFPTNNSDTIIEVDYSTNTSIKLILGVNINHTLNGLTTHQEALNIMRLNLTATNQGTTVFSKENVTWAGGTVWNDTVTTWTFSYEVVLNFFIQTGQIYAVIITYEVYAYYED